MTNPSGASVMSANIPKRPKWPARLKEISGELEHPRDETSQRTACGEAWKILFPALSLYLRFHASRVGNVSRDDLEDLAAEKSLDLLRRVVSGKTDLSNRSPAEIQSFLSKVARNDLMDLVRKAGRWVELGEEDGATRGIRLAHQESMAGKMDSPDTLVERKEFAAALRQCAERLNPRPRLIWFFRVFYGMSSKDIAVHPKVSLKVSHVDVVLQRSRQAIRECMSRRGYESHDMPPGTFVELWKDFRHDAI